MIEVRTSYIHIGHGLPFDKAAAAAVGRPPDFSGFHKDGNRDLGWVCKSELEAERIKRVLAKIGLSAEIR